METEIDVRVAVEVLIYAMANLFRIYLLPRYIHIFVGDESPSMRLRPGRAKEVFAYGLFFAVNTGLSLAFRLIWLNITVNLAGIGLLVFLYTRSLKTGLFTTFVIYLIHMGCDTVSYFLFEDYTAGRIVGIGVVSAVVTAFLVFISVLILEKIVSYRKNAEEVQNLPLILVPVCSIAAACTMLYMSNKNDIRAMVVIVCVGLLTVNFLVLYLYNLLRRSFSEKYENEMLRQKVQIYSNQIDIILQNEDKVRTLKHDMKHHMNELKLLAGKNNAGEIREYIDSMEEFIENPDEIVASGNMEIDSVLNYMLQKAREKLHTVNARVLLPKEIDHSFDINIIMGNLLENAIRGAQESGEKLLNVRVRMKQGVLLVEVENSCREETILRESAGAGGIRFATTKKEKEDHGIGLYSVRKIVEKYNGIMEFSLKENLFCVKLMLYMSA